MAKNYESESKNSKNYTGTSSKNTYGKEAVTRQTQKIKPETRQMIKLLNLTALRRHPDIDQAVKQVLFQMI